MLKKFLITLKSKNSPRGFTMTELLVVMGVMAILFGLVTMNLVQIQNRTNLDTDVTTLVSEIKQQQLKAMLGDTEGRTNPDTYGIYFTTQSYTLFHGTTFNPADVDNFTVTMEDNIQFSTINLPSQSIIFSRVSGEIYNFNPSLDSVTMTNTTSSDSQTIQFNRYGVITGIN